MDNIYNVIFINLYLFSLYSHPAPPQYEIACFVLDVNIFPTVLENFKESLDYDNVLVTARSCAKLAFDQNYRYFGLANNGECRVGPNMTSNFLTLQTSEECSSFVGKTGAIYVYTLGEFIYDNFRRKSKPLVLNIPFQCRYHFDK